MTLNEAFVRSAPGDRLKHTEYQLVIPRREDLVDTVRQMTQPQFRATNDDKWIILTGKETR